MAWRRLHVFGRDGPERNVPAVFLKPTHCATHRVPVLRHALQHDPGAALVLKEERALLQLLDECHTAECRLVRRRVAASRHTQLVVELANSGHSWGGEVSLRTRGCQTLLSDYSMCTNVYVCI